MFVLLVLGKITIKNRIILEVNKGIKTDPNINNVLSHYKEENNNIARGT